MHRETFESVALTDSFADIFGKKAESKMEKQGKEALAEIAQRLPDGFSKKDEKQAVELFRRARLFLNLNGFDRAGALYFSAKTVEDFEAQKREHNLSLLHSFYPSFPEQNFDTFCKQMALYQIEWRRQRKSLGEYLDEQEASSKQQEQFAKKEPQAEQEQTDRKEYFQRVRKERRMAMEQDERAAQPDGLDLLTFFSQPAHIQAVLLHLPIQLKHGEVSEAEYAAIAQKAGVSTKQVAFCHNRFRAYRRLLDDFTTQSNGKNGGRIDYLRVGCAETETSNLLQSGKALFILKEVDYDDFPTQEKEEAFAKPFADLARTMGFSFAHCYFFASRNAECYRTEPYPLFPVSLTGERVILCGGSAECRKWFCKMMPQGEISDEEFEVEQKIVFQ